VLFETRTERDRVIAALDAADIESRPLWKPMHLQPVFEGAASWVSGVSDDLFDRGLCLPSGSGLDDGAIVRVERVVERL
jgi:UDP-N-acetylbacillosamine transaminase